jgi:hypothetical protein
MSRARGLVFGFLFCLIASPFVAASSTEVLYVVQRLSLSNRQWQDNPASVLTYNIDPATAVATQVGKAVILASTTFSPLTVNGRNLLYVWNSTGFWVYGTDSNGVPNAEPLQHLQADFAYPVNGFVVDPKGHYAYAVIQWDDSNQNYTAKFVLFTIDPVTGKLTNTNHVVATYGPAGYTSLISFMFGTTGRKLWVESWDDGPHTCGLEYNYYPVQPDGLLEPEQSGNVGMDCTEAGAIAVTDSLGGSAMNCCGRGDGWLTVSSTVSSTVGHTIQCDAGMLPLCGDDIDALTFDPTNENLFVTDGDTSEIYITRMDFVHLRLLQTSSSIPFETFVGGVPAIFFSPDAQLVYAVYGSNIHIYGFEPEQGNLTVDTTMRTPQHVNIVLATLAN